MKKRMIIMLIGILILFGSIFGFQVFKGRMIKKFLGGNKPPVTVSTIKASYDEWQPKLTATASLKTVQGVDISTEISGIVSQTQFKPGAYVRKGTILIQLTQDAEKAQLNSLQASAELAQTTYNRDKAQFDIEAISQATLDIDAADLKSKLALVAQQKAIIDKKTIIAPFSGRLGISYVNEGQYINAGDKIVTLQALDPMYADFFLPQQYLNELKVGQSVTLTTNTYPNLKFRGTLTTIDPKLDAITRNVLVQALIKNPDHRLLPGMFGHLEIQTSRPQKRITLPQTAISFNTYGDLVYLVKEEGKNKEGKPNLKAVQQFVTTSQTRGDQIAVIRGIKEGDIVVTTGQMKLRNGSDIIINNKIIPKNNAHPVAANE